MYFLFKMGIFHSAMFVYRRVRDNSWWLPCFMLTTPGSDERLVHLRIQAPGREKIIWSKQIHVSGFYLNLWGCTPLHVLLKPVSPSWKGYHFAKKKRKGLQDLPTFQESMRPVTWLKGVRTNHWMSPIFVWPYYFSSCSMYRPSIHLEGLGKTWWR